MDKKPISRKRKSNKNSMPAHMELNVNAGDNARYLRQTRASIDLPPIDISDSKQVEKRINEYFDYCEQHDCKPGFVGMANWLGIDRSTLNSWKRGEYRGSTHSPVIQKYVSHLEELWEIYMLEGKVNVVAGIFIGKQYFQMSDKQEIAIAQDNAMRQAMSVDEIVKNLPESSGDDYTVE